jgi:hypothetical protein
VITKTLHFQLRNETPGALRYEEIDGQNRPVEHIEATIGTLYVRKSAMEGTKPQFFTVTIVEG